MATEFIGGVPGARVVKLTAAELNYLDRIRGSGDRGGFYLGYYAMTGSLQAIEQAKIATFSQGLGGIAYGANRFLQSKFAPSQYAGIYQLSQLVVNSGLASINTNVAAGGSGVLNDADLFASARLAWANRGQANQFPGNFFAWTGVARNAVDQAGGPAVSPLTFGQSLVQALNELKAAGNLTIDGFTERFFSQGTLSAGVGFFRAGLFGKSLSDFTPNGTLLSGYRLLDTPDGGFKVLYNTGTNKVEALFDQRFFRPTVSDIAEAFVEVFAALSRNGLVESVQSLSSYRAFLNDWLTDVRRKLTETAQPNGDAQPNPLAFGYQPSGYVLAVSATNGNDTIWGTSPTLLSNGQDTIHGQSGNDVIFGGGGNDTLSGGDGEDIIYGETGDDNLDGGVGSDVLRGGLGNDNLIGGDNDDILDGGDLKTTSGSGKDALDGGAGDDFLYGADGDDTLKGGTGNDRYQFLKGQGNDTIEDSDGQGEIFIAEAKLTGGKIALNANNDWFDEVNKVGYRLTSGTLTNGGELLISGPSFGSGTVTVKNFKNGNLGIDLPDNRKLEILSGHPQNPFRGSGGHDPAGGVVATIKEGLSKFFTVALGFAADTAQTIKVGLGALADKFKAIFGDETVPFTNGAVELTIPEGQNTVTFALVQQGDVDVDQSINLTATLVPSPADPVATPVSHSITLALDAREENASPVTTRTIVGGFAEGTDDLGNRNRGAFDPNRDDTLADSTGNDLVASGGGNDFINAFRGGDDRLEAGPGIDAVDAGPGNDWVLGEAGRDLLFGGLGDDRLFAEGEVALEQAILDGALAPSLGAGGDFLNGNEGADILIGSHSDNILNGGAGADVIVAGGGDDIIEADGDLRGFVQGQAASVTVSVTTDADGSPAGRVAIAGTVVREPVTAPGDDLVHGGSGGDFVFGGGGDDTLFGEAGDDTLLGEAGADTLLGGEGADQLVGDNGGSVLAYALHGGDFLDGGAGNDFLWGGGAADALYGGAGDDQIVGDSSDINAGDDYIDGEAGNDVLAGAAGADTILGGEGNDQIEGDSASTAPAFQGADEIFGEAGNDLVRGGGGDDFIDGGEGDDIAFGDAGADTLIGGAGADQLVGDTGTDGPVGAADFLDGGAGADQLFGEGGDDVLIGGLGADRLQGGAGSDQLEGGADNDIILGQAGNDFISGGDGDDQLAGEDGTLAAAGGDDFIEGGAGNDRLFGEGGADTLSGGEGNDQMAGGFGDDTLEGGTGNDLLQADAGNDMLAGGAGIDQLQGGEGADILDGGEDADTLFGEAGEDTLAGGAGADFLQGGAGNDTLEGGAGRDIYAYSRGDGADIISDSGGNTLRLNFAFGPNVVSLELGSLKLNFFGGDEIHIEGFDPDDPLANPVIDTFEFTNGTVTLAQLLTQGFDLKGTPQADVIEGTALADTIKAFDGDDVVIAKSGNDTVDLGAGDDIADAGDGNDFVLGQDGADIVFGGGGHDTLLAGAGADRLFGEAGDDLLDGGSGADRMEGGAGADTYSVDDLLDLVIENPDEGRDSVASDISYTLTANVEALTLLGATGAEALTGTGNALDNEITGNGGANLLLGLDGNDFLRGGSGADRLDGGLGTDFMSGGDGNDLLDGGAGADVMVGGFGDDTFVVDGAADAVSDEYDFIERGTFIDPVTGKTRYGRLAKSGGADTVLSRVTFSLGQRLENLTLTGAAEANGVGTVERNVLRGNDAANALYAYRLNGAAEDYFAAPFGGGLLIQFTSAANAVEELLFDRANLGLWRGEFQSPFFGPVVADIVAGEGDLVVGGGGNDALFGHIDHDRLEGGDGNDLLYGFAGADTMVGGAGDDTYVVSGQYSFVRGGIPGSDRVSYSDNSADVLIEGANAGIDTVVAEINFTLGADFENLTLVADTRNYDPDGVISTLRFGRPLPSVGTGNSQDNVLRTEHGGDVTLFGLAGADALFGGNGADRLDGGSGADAMFGRHGNDVYVVDDAGDLVIEEAGQGFVDLVESGLSYTLTANVENLTLTGSQDLTGTGNALNNVILGNAGANALAGLAGNDTLDGGAGADLMTGGAGDDSYRVDSAGDVTAEAPNEGSDSVFSTRSHTLGDNLEALFLQGVEDLTGTGNALANLIVGNAGANALSGLAGNDVLDGGAGVDAMAGGAGDDTYRVDSSLDTVIEAPDEGIDSVESSASFTLGENVEKLRLLGVFSQNPFLPFRSGTGNALDNAIIGSDGQNSLFGLAGNDNLDGRAGNDTIRGDAGADALYGGDDAVRGGIILPPSEEGGGGFLGATLAPNADILFGGAGNDTLDGGSGDDRLFGEDGDDVLYGGNDGLTAGGGIGGGGLGGGGLGGGGLGGGLGFPGEGGGGAPRGPQFLTNNDTLDGGAGRDSLDGGSGDDQLFGGEGADQLFGGLDGPLNTTNDDTLDGGAGIDAMRGGTGNDRYFVDGFFKLIEVPPGVDDCGEPVGGGTSRVYTTDAVFENPGAGHDVVFSTVSFTLSANVEELHLSGRDALEGTGNALGNLIEGNAFDNVLDGAAGADTLIGGLGNDTYVLDNPGDVVVDLGGVDTAKVSAANYLLPDGLENLTLMGGLNGRAAGNAGANVLTGDASNNLLEGLAGNDTLIGRCGDDTLLGGAGDDTLDGGAGVDTLLGGLGNDVYLVSRECPADDDDDDDQRHGNEGVGNGEDPPPPGHEHNQNDGPGTSPGHPGSRGGAHAGGSGHHDGDHHGGSHDDHGDHHDCDDDHDDHEQCRVDEVVENANEGYDIVFSSADFTLPANVEELRLTGEEDLEGRGNALDNVIVGNTGDNRLYGEAGNDLLLDDAGEDRLEGGAGDDVLDGGAEDDTLVGGAGNDVYVHAKRGGDDVVQDSGGEDTIRFGEGIATGNVTVRRQHNDLVLKLSHRDGSVTVKDWFSSASKRVEQVQFADGTVWNEAAIRARAGSRGQGGSSGEHGAGGGEDDDRRRRGHGNHEDSHGGEHPGGQDRRSGHDGRNDRDDNGMRDAIAARLARKPDYDFTALAVYLARQGGGGYGAMTPPQIAERWLQVQNRVSHLANMDDDDCGGGHGDHRSHGGCDDDGSRHGGGWGHAGSTGQNRGCGGMDTFAGLGEGFRRL